MAAKNLTTLVVLLMLSFQAVAQQSPETKRSKFRLLAHWMATHKKTVAIGAGTAITSGVIAWKVTRPTAPPSINMGPAVPCPSSACITVPK